MSKNKKPYYCAINHPDDNNTSSLIKESYDFMISPEDFTLRNNEGYPIVFDKIYDNIIQMDTEKFIPITFSSDVSICASSIVALNEKYFNETTNESNYKVLIITDKHMNETNIELQNDTNYGLENFIIPTVTNKIVDKMVTSKKNIYLKNSQIMMIGINNTTNDDVYNEKLIKSEIKHLTVKKIQQMSMDKILQHIDLFMSPQIENTVLHVIFDLAVVDKKCGVTPSVHKQSDDDTNIKVAQKNGLSPDEVNDLIFHLKNYNICGVDILAFNASIDSADKRASRITAEFTKRIFIDMLDIKENKINIFTEDSQFLIFRPADPVDIETDIGWYILRNIDIKLKNDLLQQLELTEKIITIEIDCVEYLVTSTTMNEQNMRSYYTANSVYDICLFPSEKTNMMFEMLNCK